MTRENTEYETGYTVVAASSAHKLSTEVNRLIKQGWRPQGGLSHGKGKDPNASRPKDTFCQAMVYDQPKEMREHLSKGH